MHVPGAAFTRAASERRHGGERQQLPGAVLLHLAGQGLRPAAAKAAASASLKPLASPDNHNIGDWVRR